jgi:hypothetical protein
MTRAYQYPGGTSCRATSDENARQALRIRVCSGGGLYRHVLCTKKISMLRDVFVLCTLHDVDVDIDYVYYDGI